MTASPIICAALCWYDEPVESLERCVRSLHGFAHMLVSLDGPYAHFPHAERRSPDEQVKAIEYAARAIRMPYAPIGQEPDAPTQAAKRTRLYRAAASLAGRDGWVLIIDADEELSGDYADARYELARAEAADAATVTIRTGSAIAAHPRLLRALPDLTCGPEYHGMLSATDYDGRRVNIRDRREIIRGERPRPRRGRDTSLAELLTITNHTNDRPDERKAAKREYVRRRTLAGIDL